MGNTQRERTGSGAQRKRLQRKQGEVHTRSRIADHSGTGRAQTVPPLRKKSDRDVVEEERRRLPKGKIRTFALPRGLPPIPQIMNELIDYTNVLLGRDDPPTNHGTMTLMEVADAYYARASELTMLIQQAEREGTVLRGTNYYRVRTGELRTFMDMAKRAADLGSRRLTEEDLLLRRAQLGRESA